MNDTHCSQHKPQIPLGQVFRDTCNSSGCDAKVHSPDSAVCSWIVLGAVFLFLNHTERQKTVKSWDLGTYNHYEMIPSHTRSFITSTVVLATRQSSLISPLRTKLYPPDLKTQIVPRSKHCASNINTDKLLLYREIIAVCSDPYKALKYIVGRIQNL